ISLPVPRLNRYFFIPGGILSPDGRCRAFDASAKGTAFAEGVGVVMLMRLEDALNHNHHIYATILGSAVNNDASLKAGFTAPSVDGQARVIRQAQAVAGIDPALVSYVETHGTGTILGDAVEMAALRKVFRASTQKVGFCGIGSVKTNVGHLSTAAGVAGLIKTALALKYRQIPASLNFEEPNQDLDLADSPFYVNTKLSTWEAKAGTSLYAGVSSFGIGGTNAHVVLTEPPSVASSPSRRQWHPLLLSAKTERALGNATTNLCDYLRQRPEKHFADIAYTLQVGRSSFEYRRVVVCSDYDDSIQALESLDSARMLTRKARSIATPVVFMFPGQGAQYPGMGAELYKSERVFREQMDLCLSHLTEMDCDLRSLLYPAPDSASTTGSGLQDTAFAQPALFVTEYALAKLLESWGIRPTLMIGHSVGEYVAACLSGVFPLRTALRLLASRGRIMQSMQPGRMLSVALSTEKL